MQNAMMNFCARKAVGFRSHRDVIDLRECELNRLFILQQEPLLKGCLSSVFVECQRRRTLLENELMLTDLNIGHGRFPAGFLPRNDSLKREPLYCDQLSRTFLLRNISKSS